MSKIIFRRYKKNRQNVNLNDNTFTSVDLPGNMLNALILRVHIRLS